MKPDTTRVPTAVDRLATADEILAAVLTFPGPVEQCAMEILGEIASDFGGYVRMPAVEFETSASVEELAQEEGTKPN